MIDENDEIGTMDKDGNITYSDFADTSSVKTEHVETIDPEQTILKQNILTDTVTLGTSLAINVIPMIVGVIKSKNDGKVVKLNKSDVIRTVISAALPAVSVIDDLVFKGKIKSKIPLNHARNIVNMVQAYPSVHKYANNFVTNIVNQNVGKPKVELRSETSTQASLSMINLFAPYFVSKFTNKDLSFGEKLNSALPISLFGKLIRYTCGRDPKLQRMYDTATNVVGFASNGTKLLGSSVRSTPGSTINKATNSLSGALNIISDAMGMNRGNLGGSNYNGWGGRGFGGGSFGGGNGYGSYDAYHF